MEDVAWLPGDDKLRAALRAAGPASVVQGRASAHPGSCDWSEAEGNAGAALKSEGEDTPDLGAQEDLLLQVLERTDGGYALQLRGARRHVAVRSMREHSLARYMIPKEKLDLSKVLVSPMPGKLVSMSVEEGDAVQDGQALCVVEAMKMQNVLRAQAAGVVKSIKAAPGATLTVDQVIIEFESKDGDGKGRQ